MRYVAFALTLLLAAPALAGPPDGWEYVFPNPGEGPKGREVPSPIPEDRCIVARTPPGADTEKPVTIHTPPLAEMERTALTALRKINRIRLSFCKTSGA